MVAMSALTNERGYIGGAGRRPPAPARRDARDSATSSTPIGRQELTALWSRGTALWAMGQRQGPVASILSSIAQARDHRAALRHGANFRTEAAGADAMLAGSGERRPAVGARRADRGRHQSDPAQHHRRAHPRPPEGAEAHVVAGVVSRPAAPIGAAARPRRRDPTPARWWRGSRAARGRSAAGSSACGKWPTCSKISSRLPGIASCAATPVAHRDDRVARRPTR